MAKKLPSRINNHSIREYDIDGWVRLEITMHRVQSAGQVLFVAVQIEKNFALCFAETSVHRVVHASIFFDKCFDTLVLQQPLQCAIVGTSVLDDVLRSTPWSATEAMQSFNHFELRKLGVITVKRMVEFQVTAVSQLRRGNFFAGGLPNAHG